MPRSIDSISVSAQMATDSGSKFYGIADLSRNGYGNYVASVSMSDQAWKAPKIVIKGFNCSTFSALGLDPIAEKKPWDIKKIASNIYWKEDLGHIRQSEAIEIFTPKTPTGSEKTFACDLVPGDSMRITNSMIARYLEISGHKLPSQHVLEIGGDTASLTQSVL